MYSSMMVHCVQGSVYKKANPRADINPEKRDAYWDQQEVSFFGLSVTTCSWPCVCVCVCVCARSSCLIHVSLV